MTKRDYLKKANIFLKMAECDFTVIKVIKAVKFLLYAALIINFSVFAVMMLCGVKR